MNSNILNNKNGAMNWQDAALISAILTLAAFFTVFMPTWSYLQAKASLGEFLYAALQFFGGSFFTNFIALAGLSALTTKKKEAKQT